MAENEPLKPKPRPIVRIGILLISHSILVSVICCAAGVLALLLLPVLAKKTYISENALMPGSASPMLSNQDISESNSFIKEITTSNLRATSAGIEVPRLIAQHMAAVGAEVSYHKFHPQLNKFHPLDFFSSPDPGIIHGNYSCQLTGVSTVGIIRAPRGDGKEAIVLVTPYNSVTMSTNEALSLGIVYSVFSLLSRVTWLAKDIIWLAADSRHGEYAPVAAWLRDYHTPLFGGFSKENAEICYESSALSDSKTRANTGNDISDAFKRAGTMAAALIIKVEDKNEEIEKDSLSIYAEASNGQMPNLDLINVVNYLAVHGQGLHVKIEKTRSLLNSKWIQILGQIFELVGRMTRILNPQSKFGISVADYVEGTSTLASSLYNQALGVPTGPHGAFRDFQVDAITLEISSKFSLNNKARRTEFLQRGGRLVEGVIRSVNNLLEKFHQSFFLYLLTSPSKFVSVGVYMIAFALLVAPLPIVAASFYSDANKLNPSSPTDPTVTAGSWKWLHSAKTVFIVHLWGAIVTLLPYLVCQVPNITPTTRLLLWLLLSMFSLLVLHLTVGSPFALGIKEWAILKSVTISAAFIGLCLMSVINFATAEIGALLLVPMCLLASPLRLDLKARTFKAFVRALCNMVLGFISFPPAAFILMKGTVEGFGSVNVGDFWNWVESLWTWNSATYIYIYMVHLPCWVLCSRVLLNPF